MKNTRHNIISLAVAFAILLLATFTTAAVAGEFTADIVQKTPMGIMTGKIYVKGRNTRQEMTMMGQNQIIITRTDKHVNWILMPEQGTYMEMKWTPQQGGTDLQDLKKRGKVDYEGKEKISGYTCAKYRYTPNDPSEPPMTLWYSKKLDHPIKMLIEAPQGQMTILYKNIKKKKLSDSLFRVPKGYEKVSMPMMIPGMRNQ